MSVVSVCEELYDREDRCPTDLEQREDTETEDMLQTSIPCLSEELLEYLEKTIGEFLSIFFGHFFKRIKSNRVIEVCGIEYDDIFYPIFRDELEDIIHEISMGIQESKSTTIDDVRIGEELEKF